MSQLEFKSTTTPKSQHLLANTLGYPKSWRVIRTVPHPILHNKNNITFQDMIYTGDPEVADMYYNHTAAMDAAMKWRKDSSTPFENNGGHLLPLDNLEFDLEEGDEVDVYYEEDCTWYRAKILEVVDYRDDVRYTVQFKEDESTQSNVCLDRIRQIKTKKNKSKSSTGAAAAGKKRKSSAISTPTDDNDAKMSKSDADANTTTTTPNKKKSKGNNSSTKKSTTKSTTKKRKNYYGAIGYVPDTSELNLASKMGLPEGWAVNIKPNSRFTFRSPDGDLRFTSKKAVFSHLGLTPPKHGHNPLDDEEEDVVEDTDEEDDEDEDNDGETELGSSNEKMDIQQNNNGNGNGNDPMEIEDGDPPWRTSGHKLLGRRVEYIFLDGVTGKGTLTGWISDKDVDKEGNPGFVSERTDLPACLFHVTMDSDCPIASQDFEGYEVKEILIDDSD